MAEWRVLKQVEGSAGYEELGHVPAELSAAEVLDHFKIHEDDAQYTIPRKIDGEMGWLIKVKSRDPVIRGKMQRFDDLAAICSFLGFAERDEPNMMYGARKIGEVIDAWCRVSGMTRAQIELVLEPTPEEPGLQ